MAIVRAMAQDILAVIMAGGQGGRLRPLTDLRAKPAVPFGGIYRIIDFSLTNCINSDIRKIFVLTQYKSNSLSRHLKSGWDFLSRRLDQYIEEIPAQMQSGDRWYQGTADAVRQNMPLIQSANQRYTLVIPGDHIYKMDYRFLRDFHASQEASLSVSAIRVPIEEARGRYGVMEVDENWRIIGFEEKPEHPKAIPGTGDCLASMGIYLFNTSLLRRLNENHVDDLSLQWIPQMVRDGARIYAYDYARLNQIQEYEYVVEDGERSRRLVPQSSDAGYWRDVGTIEALWSANLDLVSPRPLFNLYGEKWPLFSTSGFFPPAKFVHELPGRTGQANNSIVADGVILSGCLVRNSVLSSGLYVHSYSVIENSVLFGGSLSGGGLRETVIGRGCRIRNAIIDKNVELRAGMVVGYDRQQDIDHGFFVHPIGDGSDYVVVIPGNYHA